MRKFVWGLQIIFNFILSYCAVAIVCFSIAFMKNQPKGSGYAVPESEFFLNFTIGLFLLLTYLLILVLGNIGFYKKGAIVINKYFIILIGEFAVGISVFLLTIGTKNLV